VLRKEWGFSGFVVSDWASIKQLEDHGVASSPREAARLAFTAGVDMDMANQLYYPQLLGLVKDGVIPAERVDVSARRILAAKAKLGLLDDPFRFNDPAREKAELLKPANLEAARDLARRSFVLLKNEGHALPLKKTAKVALIGALADSQIDLLGTWRARGETTDAITIRKGLSDVYGSRLTYARGCGVQPNDREDFAAAKAAAEKADVVVAVVGESWDMTGEGHSRSNLDLPGEQTELLAELHRTGKPVVVVLMCGRALTLEKVLPLADAVMVAWIPGTMGGPAVADVLTGDYNPSGKLPVTFPRNVGQVPIFYNSKASGRPQPDGPREQYKSNYIDVANSPLFPFGYGLSYTHFRYSHLRVNRAKLPADGTLEVTVTLENRGDYDGEETAQLYTRQLFGSVTRPVRELKGFQQVFLKKGEQRDLTFTVKATDLAFWRADMTYGTEPGSFEVFVGGNSDANLSEVFELAAN